MHLVLAVVCKKLVPCYFLGKCSAIYSPDLLKLQPVRLYREPGPA